MDIIIGPIADDAMLLSYDRFVDEDIDVRTLISSLKIASLGTQFALKSYDVCAYFSDLIRTHKATSYSFREFIRRVPYYNGKSPEDIRRARIRRSRELDLAVRQIHQRDRRRGGSLYIGDVLELAEAQFRKRDEKQILISAEKNDDNWGEK